MLSHDSIPKAITLWMTITVLVIFPVSAQDSTIARQPFQGTEESLEEEAAKITAELEQKGELNHKHRERKEVAGFVNLAEGNLTGGQLGVFVNIVEGRMTGVQLSGIANVVEHNARGVQLSGIANVVEHNARGAQLAGVANIVGGQGAYAQVAGVTNISGGDAGGQISGVVNVAEDVSLAQVAGVSNISGRGAMIGQIAGVANIAGGSTVGQISGVANVAGERAIIQMGLINVTPAAMGLQVGFINIADRQYGVPIGLLNLVNGVPIRYGLARDGEGQTMLALRTGSRYVYSIIALQGDQTTTLRTLFPAHFGLGAQLPLGLAYVAVEYLQESGTHDDDRIGVRLGLRFSRKMGLSVGMRIPAQSAWDGTYGSHLSDAWTVGLEWYVPVRFRF